MPRRRLLDTLAAVWDHRLALVVAPPGSGKTTLLSQFAATSECPVAWYRPGPGDGDPPLILNHLEAAVEAAIGDVPGPWRHAADAVYALQRSVRSRLLLVIDDLHVLAGTPGEATIEQLVEEAPPEVAVVAASRAQPGLNLPCLRVAGALLEVGADDLRFRTWEVGQLFRDLYQDPLSPEEVAELARRTEGWAAGLQLFHLATRGRSGDERRRTMAAVHTRSRLVREYLTRNVLDGLDERLRTFLLRTSVLGRLNGPLCDQLLGCTGSAALLAELERRQLFTHALGDDGWFRYHELLRSHLESMVLEDVGDAAIRLQRRRAGRLLERAGAFDEALEAYCRAEDWTAARRLLGRRGETMVSSPGWWADLLPPSLLDDDPWVQLAIARRHRAAGRWSSAIEAYRRAESVFTTDSAARVCQRERLALAAWVEVTPPPGSGWSGLLREATLRRPTAIAARASAGAPPSERLAAGLAALLAGDVRSSRPLLHELLREPGLDPLHRVSAHLGACLAALLAGEGPDAHEWADVADEAECARLPWLAGLARAGLGIVVCNGAVGLAGSGVEDLWGPTLRAIVSAWVGASRDAAEPFAHDTGVLTLRSIGAPVIDVWAAALAALVQARRNPAAARPSARRAESRARSLGVPGARAVALLALAAVEPGGGHAEAARSIADRCGLLLPQPSSRSGTNAAFASAARVRQHPVVRRGTPEAGEPQWTLTTFGGFSLVRSGTPVDLAPARPRTRSLLRLLALHSRRPLHREVIAEALWPEAAPSAAMRSLQVAVSSLRGILGLARVGAVIVRDGDAYRLVLPPGSAVDVAVFDAGITAAERLRSSGDIDTALRAMESALSLYRGDLLPEEGPADWVVAERDRYRAAASDLALNLAVGRDRRQESALAVSACERGLRIDRYRDDLWRLLITLHEGAGDGAAAAQARRRYRDVLTELDVSSESC
jgi:DNA-binding SARP family transcriptional activator